MRYHWNVSGNRTRFSRRAAVELCSVLCWSAPAGAHLGGDLSGVGADALKLQGAVSTSMLVDYDVQQIATAVGGRVSEYLTRGGEVFAITWSGAAPPDLTQLLGPYFAEYAAALTSLHHPGSKRSMRVVTPTLIVESSGHLRAYSGRAYLPALVPAGVALANIR
jgi:hypothetical protein